MTLYHLYSTLITALSATLLALVPPAPAQSLGCPPKQIQRLMPATCIDSITFGQSVSVVEDRLAVGRHNAAGGRVTTYVLNPGTREWELEAEIVPPGLQPGDSFGHSVALLYEASQDQWLLAVGSKSRDTSQPRSGTAYVFNLNGQGQWSLEAEVLPDVIVPYGWFGSSIGWAASEDRHFLVVGAPGSDGHRVVGSTYIFESNGKGMWRQHTQLQAPDGTPEDAFGSSVSSALASRLSLLCVGASGHLYVGLDNQPGAAYFYRFDSQKQRWILEADVEAPDPYEQDLFGDSVSVAPIFNLPGFTHRASVGRTNEGGFGFPSGHGAVYLYLRSSSGTWQLESRLLPPVANPNDMFFGHAVDLARDGSPRLLVGAPEDRQFGVACGAAYIFEQDNVTREWSVRQALFGREADVFDVFGVALALGNGISSDTTVIGAHSTQCPGGTQFDAVGAVYSFDLDPGEPGNCPPPVLTLQKVPDCSSGPGGEIEVRWFQATPDRRARIALLFGRRTGNFIIPDGNPCAGTRLGLGALDLQVAFTGSAGDFGAGRLVTTIPRAVCGAYLQLVDISRCQTSNVVRIE